MDPAPTPWPSPSPGSGLERLWNVYNVLKPISDTVDRIVVIEL